MAVRDHGIAGMSDAFPVWRGAGRKCGHRGFRDSPALSIFGV
jgi:hypothetical protein